MSENNPKASIAAIFPKPIHICEGLSVYPLTLAHYALLEDIDSYLVNGDHQPDAIESLKTMYICTHDAKDVIRDFADIDTATMAWAEKLPPGVTSAIMDAIKVQIDAMAKVIPHLSEEKKKLVETA